jgi:hypothetical protein
MITDINNEDRLVQQTTAALANKRRIPLELRERAHHAGAQHEWHVGQADGSVAED